MDDAIDVDEIASHVGSMGPSLVELRLLSLLLVHLANLVLVLVEESATAVGGTQGVVIRDSEMLQF